MKFNYQARSEDGQIQTGVVDAGSKDDAISTLQKHGLYVSYIEEEKTSIYTKNISVFKRISKKDIVLFSRQLSIMFKAGVPIVESLRSISKQTDNNKFSGEISEVAARVEGGNSLSQALEKFPKTFTPFYVGMIKSGEISGRLSESLEYLADHLEREYNFNNKVVGSMIYPAFVTLVFLAILFFLTIFIIPRMANIFEGMDLPLITRIVLAVSDWAVRWWWLPITLLVGLIVFYARYSKTENGQRTIDRVILRTPLINDFFKKINLVRVSENLSTLISGGLPIVQALEVTADILESSTYKDIVAETRDGVRRGELISKSLLKHPEYFPPLFVQMIMVGEKTGKIDSSLGNVVSFYQGEIDRALESLVKLLEPIMIIILGFLVGGLVISILMPIYQITI